MGTMSTSLASKQIFTISNKKYKCKVLFIKHFKVQGISKII